MFPHVCMPFPHPQGTPERLIMHLVEEPSVVDPTYIEDFLLTYRTFLSDPMEVGKKLLEWFQVDTLRDTVSLFAFAVVFGWCVFTELRIIKKSLASVYVEQQYVYVRRLCFYKSQGKVHDTYHSLCFMHQCYSFVFVHVNKKHHVLLCRSIQV